MSVENHFGINPDEYIRFNNLPIEQRKEEGQRNLESMKLETEDDACVSTLYPYWFGGDGKLYSNPSLGPNNLMLKQFKFNERGGLARNGFALLEKKILENPNKIVLWYSPPGRKSFSTVFPDGEVDPEEVPYRYGQLYINFFDGQKVNAAAVKIEGEGVLPLLSPQFTKLLMIQDETERISTMLLSPVVLNEDLSTFLTRPRQNVAVYKDGDGKIYYWSDVVKDLKDTFDGKRNNVFLFAKQLKILEKPVLTPQDMKYFYLSQMRDDLIQRGYGYNQKRENRGPCPGKSTSIAMIDSILGENPFNVSRDRDIYSTAYRESSMGESGDKVCSMCHQKKSDVVCGVCKACADKYYS